MSDLTSLLARAAALPGSGPRKVATLLGACVADAASRPLHWIYDVDVLNAHLEEKNLTDTPEFFPESKSPFYELETGDSSGYMDELLVGLAAINKTPGHEYDFDVLADTMKEMMGPGTKYDMAPREEYSRKKKAGEIEGPLKGKWMQGAPLKFLEGINAGKAKPLGDPDNQQSDGFCVALPYLVKLGNGDHLKDILKSFSTNPTSVEFNHVAAIFVEQTLLNAERESVRYYHVAMEALYSDAHKAMVPVFDKLDEDHVDVVGEFGRSCNHPGCLLGAVHAVLKTDYDLVKAVRMTIRAGGCNCSRAMIIGALCGARGGLDAVPTAWLEKSFQAEKVLQGALELFE